MRKRAIALLLVVSMVASLMIGVLPANGASTYSMSNVVTLNPAVKGGAPVPVGSLVIALDEGSMAPGVAGKYVYLELPSDFQWVTANVATLVDGTEYAFSAPGDVTGAVYASDPNVLKVVIATDPTNVLKPGYIMITGITITVPGGAADGPVTVICSAPNSSVFSSGSFDIAKIGIPKVQVRAMDNQTFGPPGGNVTLSVREEIIGAMDKNASSLEWRLPDGFTWDTGLADDYTLYWGTGAADVSGLNAKLSLEDSNRTLVLDNSAGTWSGSYFKLVIPVVVDQSVATSGDITVTMGGTSTVDQPSFVVGTFTAAPTIAPNGGTFFDSVSVSITGSGGDIYYTTDGSNPINNPDAIEYTGQFTLSSSTTVKAAVYGQGQPLLFLSLDSGGGGGSVPVIIPTFWSPVTSASFTVVHTPAAPTIDPDGGTFRNSAPVTIIGSGGTIYYTTNGDDPIDNPSAIEYAGQFTLTSSATVKAAVKAAADDKAAWSPVTSASFRITTSGGNGGGGGGDSESTPLPPTETVKPPVEPEVEAPTAAEPTDLAGHWAYDCVMALISHGIIKGYNDGTIQPDNEITRAEAAALLVSALGLQDYQPSIESPYQDQLPSWARQAILTATEKNLMKGYPDGTFQPDQRITRAEMCAALMQAFPKATPAGFVLGFADAGSVPDWARPFVEAAVSNGVVSGYPDNTFRPNNNIKRGEVFSIICRLMGYQSEHAKE
ncbi:MAG: hypothetical protein HPY50_18455 [Firmicutes bacterium]|nr:hypothetical protein [Bacillota bacterium]